jgi:phage major head subunit gpT-like protein
MLITKTSLDALRVGFSALYQSAYAGATTFYEQISTVVPSSTSENDYGWMAQIPQMREWLGPRILQNLSEHSYTLKNKPFELTIGVDRDKIEDDQLGIYNPLMSNMGDVSAKWPDSILTTVLQAGTTGIGFDGVAHFAATHPLNPAGNQSNNFTGSALTGTNFAAARAAMMAYTGEGGRPIGVRPNLLIVPPQLEDEARVIVVAEYGSSGATNVQRNQANVLVIPELSNAATTWYLADTTRPIKGLVFQRRKGPFFVAKDALTDDNVFHARQFLYGVDARGNAGYGPWFLISRSIA